MTCTNPVHRHPLPPSFLTADWIAEHRLNNGWQNVACPDCGEFGWLPPTITERTAS